MAKTKEEILYPKVRVETGVRDAMFNSDGLLINHDVLDAMDDYAKQESAVWKEKAEGYEKALEEIRDRYPVPNAAGNIATKALNEYGKK